MSIKIRLTEGDLHRIIRESTARVISELSRNTMQNAHDKLRSQGRYAQARTMNNLFNDMYNGRDEEGDYVNQTDLSGKGRHPWLNRSHQGESTVSNGDSTYGDETSNYNPDVSGSYLGKQNDRLARKAQQVQDWQYGKNNARPYRTNSRMTPSYTRNADAEARRQERAARLGNA